METLEEFKNHMKSRNIKLLPTMNGFNEGDTVTYNNEFGMSFKEAKIAGFVKDWYGLKNRHVWIRVNPYWLLVKFSEIKNEHK